MGSGTKMGCSGGDTNVPSYVEINGEKFYSDRFYLDVPTGIADYDYDTRQNVTSKEEEAQSIMEEMGRRGLGPSKTNPVILETPTMGKRTPKTPTEAAATTSPLFHAPFPSSSLSSSSLPSSSRPVLPPLFDRAKLVQSLDLCAAIVGTFALEPFWLRLEMPQLFPPPPSLKQKTWTEELDGINSVPTLVLHGDKGIGNFVGGEHLKGNECGDDGGSLRDDLWRKDVGYRREKKGMQRRRRQPTAAAPPQQQSSWDVRCDLKHERTRKGKVGVGETNYMSHCCHPLRPSKATADFTITTDHDFGLGGDNNGGGSRDNGAMIRTTNDSTFSEAGGVADCDNYCKRRKCGDRRCGGCKQVDSCRGGGRSDVCVVGGGREEKETSVNVNANALNDEIFCRHREISHESYVAGGGGVEVIDLLEDTTSSSSSHDDEDDKCVVFVKGDGGVVVSPTESNCCSESQPTTTTMRHKEDWHSVKCEEVSAHPVIMKRHPLADMGTLPRSLLSDETEEDMNDGAGDCYYAATLSNFGVDWNHKLDKGENFTRATTTNTTTTRVIKREEDVDDDSPPEEGGHIVMSDDRGMAVESFPDKKHGGPLFGNSVYLTRVPPRYIPRRIRMRRRQRQRQQQRQEQQQQQQQQQQQRREEQLRKKECDVLSSSFSFEAAAASSEALQSGNNDGRRSVKIASEEQHHDVIVIDSSSDDDDECEDHDINSEQTKPLNSTWNSKANPDKVLSLHMPQEDVNTLTSSAYLKDCTNSAVQEGISSSKADRCEDACQVNNNGHFCVGIQKPEGREKKSHNVNSVDHDFVEKDKAEGMGNNEVDDLVKHRKTCRGVYHPKFMLLFEKCGSIVVVVSTANLTRPKSVDASWVQRFEASVNIGGEKRNGKEEEEEEEEEEMEAMRADGSDFGWVLADFLRAQGDAAATSPNGGRRNGNVLTPQQFMKNFLSIPTLDAFRRRYEFHKSEVHLIATVPGNYPGRRGAVHLGKVVPCGGGGGGIDSSSSKGIFGIEERTFLYGPQRVEDILHRLQRPSRLRRHERERNRQPPPTSSSLDDNFSGNDVGTSSASSAYRCLGKNYGNCFVGGNTSRQQQERRRGPPWFPPGFFSRGDRLLMQPTSMGGNWTRKSMVDIATSYLEEHSDCDDDDDLLDHVDILWPTQEFMEECVQTSKRQGKKNRMRVMMAEKKSHGTHATCTDTNGVGNGGSTTICNGGNLNEISISTRDMESRLLLNDSIFQPPFAFFSAKHFNSIDLACLSRMALYIPNDNGGGGGCCRGVPAGDGGMVPRQYPFLVGSFPSLSSSFSLASVGRGCGPISNHVKSYLRLLAPQAIEIDDDDEDDDNPNSDNNNEKIIKNGNRNDRCTAIEGEQEVERIGWFLLTSACMSHGAQGRALDGRGYESDHVRYANFELGVLFCSRLQQQQQQHRRGHCVWGSLDDGGNDSGYGSGSTGINLRGDRLYVFDPLCGNASATTGTNDTTVRKIHLPIPYKLRPPMYQDDPYDADFAYTPFFHEIPNACGRIGQMRLTPLGKRFAEHAACAPATTKGGSKKTY